MNTPHLQPDQRRVCLSGDARCAALAPCLACYDRFMRYVLPRAMFIAGPSFSSDPHRAMHFMRSFSQAWTEARAHAEGGVRTVYAEPPAADVSAAPAEPPPPQTVGIDTFRAILTDSVGKLSPDKREKMRQEVAAGSIEGWAELTEEEKAAFREIVGPASAAPQVPKKEEEEKAVEEKKTSEEKNGAASTEASPEQKV